MDHILKNLQHQQEMQLLLVRDLLKVHKGLNDTQLREQVTSWLQALTTENQNTEKQNEL